jgi:CHAD domain-containing protein
MQPDIESGAFAAVSVTRLLERLAYQVNAAAHNHGEEPIHDLRVAVRRFSQSLAVLKDLYPGKELKKIRRRLKRLMDLSSEVRDCDVVRELLAKSELPGVAALQPRLAARRKEAVRMLLPALRSWSNRRTTARWRAALTPNGASHTPLSEIVRDRLPRIAKRFLKRGDRAHSATQLHQARIEGKKLRYSLELLQPVWGASVDAPIGHVKDFQVLLGKVHDAQIARTVVRELGDDSEIEGWIKKRERKKAREFRAAWDADSDALRDSLRTLKNPPRKPMTRAAGRPSAGAKTA